MENKDKVLSNSVNKYMAHNILQTKRRSLKARLARAWLWLRTRDVATFTNVLLMCLAVAMMVVLIKVVQQNNLLASKVKKPVAAQYVSKAQAKKPAPRVVSAKVPAKVSLNTSTGVAKIELPMKDVVSKATGRQFAGAKPRPVISNAEWLRQEEAVRPAARVKVLPPMSEVNGNLYIQNLTSYVVPCGTKVRGDMIIRNVKKLGFCGCVEVRGNIYVGKGTSFGPLPADAKIGGRIIY
jgi:hypothetical protein